MTVRVLMPVTSGYTNTALAAGRNWAQTLMVKQQLTNQVFPYHYLLVVIL